jgi:hypothetical protein
VYTEAAMPAAHPMNYLLDGDEVVFRTGEGAKSQPRASSSAASKPTRSMSSAGAASPAAADRPLAVTGRLGPSLRRRIYDSRRRRATSSYLPGPSYL